MLFISYLFISYQLFKMTLVFVYQIYTVMINIGFRH